MSYASGLLLSIVTERVVSLSVYVNLQITTPEPLSGFSPNLVLDIYTKFLSLIRDLIWVR